MVTELEMRDSDESGGPFDYAPAVGTGFLLGAHGLQEPWYYNGQQQNGLDCCLLSDRCRDQKRASQV